MVATPTSPWGWRRHPHVLEYGGWSSLVNKMGWPIIFPFLFFLYLFLIFYYFIIYLFLKVNNKLLLFFNVPHDELVALGSLRRDPNHQSDRREFLFMVRRSKKKVMIV
jgi:hypothetical protein